MQVGALTKRATYGLYVIRSVKNLCPQNSL